MKSFLLALGLCSNFFITFSFATVSNFEDNPKRYPFIGNWSIKITHTENSKYKRGVNLYAQVIKLQESKYTLKIVEALHKRANPMLLVTAEAIDNKIVFKRNGWVLTFYKDGSGLGTFDNGKSTVELKKESFHSATLGLEPPEGAVILFDGNDLSQWQHSDGRKASWSIIERKYLETVSQKGIFKENKARGIGGDLFTREGFGSMKFHLEFRYAVEPNKSGQGKGNSGIFFLDIGEIQILNSFGLEGYWNQCGALYKKSPPLVNAAGPPLVWQTYDVEIKLLGKVAPYQEATVTAYLNSHKIHSQVYLELEKAIPNIKIKIQDHTNILQFRNIWLTEI